MKRSNPVFRACTLKHNPENRLKEGLVNASILAGLSFFSTLVGISAAGIVAEPYLSLIAACISAGFTFFSRLAMELGLKE